MSFRFTCCLLVALSAPAFAADWRAEVERELGELGEGAGQLAAIEPITMRHGALRFLDPALAADEARGWLATRLDDVTLTPRLRHAYADAFVRSLLDAEERGVWEAAWLELAATVDDPAVRELLVASMAKASAQTMADGLGRALREGGPELRRLAAHTASLHPEGERLAGPLLTAVRDTDPAVRADAVRSLGVLRVADALPDAQRLVRDEDARVRGAALRALQRLSPERARAAAASMKDDPDAAVARLARTLAP